MRNSRLLAARIIVISYPALTVHAHQLYSLHHGLNHNPSLHDKLSLNRLYSSLDYQVAPYSVAFATFALSAFFVSIPGFVSFLAGWSSRWAAHPYSLP